MAEQTSMVKLYEALETESLERSSKANIAPVVRETVDNLFKQTGKDELLLSVVHKLVKKLIDSDDLQYSTVASAVKARKSGFALSENEDGRTIIVRSDEDDDGEDIEE